jgi:hypothetical protein
MPAIVYFGGIEKLQYARALYVCGDAAAGVKMVAHRAGYAVLVYLTYIYEEVTGLSAAVKPLFQNFSNLRVMCPEASGAKKNEIGALFWRMVDAQLQPPGCTEI